MQTVRRRLIQALIHHRSSPRWSLPPSSSISTLTRPSGAALNRLTRAPDDAPQRGTFVAPWSAIQRRGAKVLGTDVRFGNVIQRKGRIYQVLKAQHTQHGRGGATIQVELRDVDSGNKITERFRTDEAIEKTPTDDTGKHSAYIAFYGVGFSPYPPGVFVEDKSFTFLYQEGDIVTLMEPSTFEQLEVSKELFGKSAPYLKDDMTVTVQYYDGKPMSASVPIRVTCTVAEAQTHTKGLTAAPQYKRVTLDNGLTVMAPPFIEAGDEIIINTLDDSYLTRSKE